MYYKRNITYAEVGKTLLKDGVFCNIQAPGEGYEEIDAPIDDLSINQGLGLAVWAGGLMACPLGTYESMKTRLIKRRYSNDDQLAIMLNGDEEEMSRMQAWREWAGSVAKAICTLLEADRKKESAVI